MKQLLNWLMCRLGAHEWTCNAEQGIPPTKAQTDAGAAGFYSYARGYCKLCGRTLS